MPQDKIESRRAFMKKFGKLFGSAAVAAAFMAAASNDANAKPSEDEPVTGCGMWGGGCSLSCSSSCGATCQGVTSLRPGGRY